MFGALQANCGGTNRLRHDRAFAPLDQQPVIRQNRDTFCSVAIMDISNGAGSRCPPPVGATSRRWSSTRTTTATTSCTNPMRSTSCKMGFGSRPPRRGRSRCNAAGYFEPNERGSYNVNSITATRNDDGTVTINFGGCDDDRPNCLPIMDGWNDVVRYSAPTARSWTAPGPSRPSPTRVEAGQRRAGDQSSTAGSCDAGGRRSCPRWPRVRRCSFISASKTWRRPSR